MSNRFRKRRIRTATIILGLTALLGAEVYAGHGSSSSTQSPPPAVKTVRLYIFDCGLIKMLNPKTFGFEPGQLANTDAAVPCHLIVHPKGTLIWDTGVVPDERIGTGAPGTDRASKPLKDQMAAIGYRPADVTYLALSHYHVDHAANANAFQGATWLVRRAERDAMFAEKPPPFANASDYSALRNSKATFLDKDEYDVFGDGQVVIKAAVGHTPGHQVLILKFAKTGPVMLAGDLYHFPEERNTDKVPTFEFNQEQSLASRAVIEAYVKKTGTQLWIEHDFVANSKLKKSPLYYE
jgi:glyoxylase-like metal-dependent hydrolase (beta-lactamase superfamily II)